jgi:hypothetical protein
MLSLSSIRKSCDASCDELRLLYVGESASARRAELSTMGSGET